MARNKWKLNNKGWGALDMLLLSIGLLIALLVAIYYIGRLYGSLDNATKNKHYVDLTAKLEQAAERYVLINEIQVDNSLRIDYSNLKALGYITDFTDNNGRECNGYVMVTKPELVKIYTGHIICPNYETPER